jgi:pilus assembly protein Flp/PilA
MARMSGMATFLAMWLGGFVPRVARDEKGQGLAEYALILVLIAIVCVAALVFLGGSISGVLNEVGTNLAAQPGGSTPTGTE